MKIRSSGPSCLSVKIMVHDSGIDRNSPLYVYSIHDSLLIVHYSTNVVPNIFGIKFNENNVDNLLPLHTDPTILLIVK